MPKFLCDITHDDLPAALPVFPLAGALLLPHGQLPLNIFEPRYLAMVDEAVRTDRLIGMIQPIDPDSRQPDPELYRIGCAGRITSFTESHDRRYEILLTGLCRFEVTAETPVPTELGYRRVEASWQRFENDLRQEVGPELDRGRLITSLKPYFKSHGMKLDWEGLQRIDDVKLITALAMVCPFAPNEQQALLEAADCAERARILLTVIEMANLDRVKPSTNLN